MGWFTKKKKGETTEEELQEVQTQEKCCRSRRSGDRGRDI